MSGAASRRLLVPEVVQTSSMDCGPAALKALLEGHGVPVDYGRLREACQTDVDGSCIDTLEEVAQQLGLDAEQVMVPADHLLLEDAGCLPALLVVRHPDGYTHFVVAWRQLGPLIQLMDPATGRRWTTRSGLLSELYEHQLPVPAEDWREWAGSEEFLVALAERARALGIAASAHATLAERAADDASWRGLATLDAALRMMAAIVQSGGLRRGAEAQRALERFLAGAQAAPDEAGELIPEDYWSVRPLPPTPDRDEPPMLLLRGALLVRVRGRLDGADAQASPAPLSRELAAALAAPPSHPSRDLLRMLREDGLLGPAMLTMAVVLAAGGVVIEALLLRGLLGLGRHLELVGQKLGFLTGLLVFLAALLLLELPVAAGLFRMGRRLEGRLRLAFLRKIPRLADRYFRSRLTSDMVHRAHTVHLLRQVPLTGARVVHGVAGLVLTGLGIVWLDPWLAPLVLLAGVVALGVPLLAHPALAERDLRLRTHVGALARFFLDSLLGLVPLRTHGAASAVQREHEGLLVEWARASLRYHRLVVGTSATQMLGGVVIVAALLGGHLLHAGEPGAVLLLVYWALRFPALGQDIADAGRQYPALRNTCLRLLEPLGAAEAEVPEVAPPEPAPTPVGADLDLRDLAVVAAGHVILEGVNLRVSPGEQLAIVGPSGAGKSSLVGILLGFHRPAAGECLVDGAPLDGAGLAALRRDTAWVDPAIRIWNRPLLDNLLYGAALHAQLGTVLEQAELLDLLETLPDGLQTPLGEAGGSLSGGEGQRVRLGRAMLGRPPRLVVLDEAFRGLDRPRRQRLLAAARQHWRGATLLCVTHDISETQAFDRVIVLDGGQLVEDGPPATLAAREGSRYRAMLDAERALRRDLWREGVWTRFDLVGGRLERRPLDDLRGEG